MKNQGQNVALSILLYGLAGITAVSLVAAGIYDMVYPDNPGPYLLRLIGWPMKGLFEAVHWAAAYIPIFLFVQAWCAGQSIFPHGLWFGSLVGIVPSLSLAVTLRILFSETYRLSPVTRFAADAMSREGAAAVFGLLTAISMLIVVNSGGWYQRRKRGSGAPVDFPSRDEKLHKPSQYDDRSEHTGDLHQDIEGLPEVDPREASLMRQDSWFYGDSEESGESGEEMDRLEQPAPVSDAVGGPDPVIDSATEQDFEAKMEAAEALSPEDLNQDGDVENTEEHDPPFLESVDDAYDFLLDAGLEEPGSPDEYTREPESHAVTQANIHPSGEVEETDRESSGEEEPLQVFFTRGRISTDPLDDDAEQSQRSWILEDFQEEPEDGVVVEPEEPQDSDEIIVEMDEGEEDLILEESGDSVGDEPVDESVLPPVEPAKFTGPYDVPIRGILDIRENGDYWRIDKGTTDAAEVLRTTLQEFGIQADVTGIRKGPVITMFEILPAPGVKLTRIVNLADNIALRLAAQSVRIVAPIPGKHAVGIEIPNKNRHLVSFAELLQDPQFNDPRHEIPVALGKDITGDAQIVDLAKTPHLLIAGATGSGKSVCVNSLICSVLYRRSPEEVKMVLIDPKIVELKFYNDIPHLLTPVITDPKKAFQALQWCLYEMERRYSLLDAMAVRDIRSYNKKIKAKNIATTPLPYIVVVVDEFADLMATTGKELESTLARLAAMSRAVGIHLVLATQRPSTDVITGLIKANIPSRIAFMVASKVDSRIILDAQGAEKLLGRGDMLFTSAWDPFPFRMQGAFLSEEEVERVVEHVRTLGEPDYIDEEIFIEDEDEPFYQDDLEDPLMEKAIEVVTTAGKASASYLQRRLKVGYNRAARMVEMLEDMGIVGPQNGSKPREILRSPERVI